MSTSWRQGSDGARSGRPGPLHRNGSRGAAPGASLGESINHPGSDGRIAREGRHRELIEASLDRAEAYERLGDFEHALEWLDRAAAISGALPAAYRAQRARCARAAALRPCAAGGDWKNRVATSGEGAAGR
jgi:tetratricopeptide (TPR) repeat protein